MTNSVAKGKSVTLALSGKLNCIHVSLQKRQFSKEFSCIGLAVQGLTTEFVIQHLLLMFFVRRKLGIVVSTDN